jgi:outer membrane lipase/esterase
MKKITTFASATLLAIASQTITANPYSGLYVFGDSLYDSGNFGVDRRFTNTVGPTYQPGEVSGPIGIQFIADHIGLELVPSEFGGTNYAVGGYRSLDVLESITADSTRLAFNSYFYNLRLNNQTVDPNALYVVEGGGNDMSRIRTSTDYTQIANNLLASAKALSDNGANYVVITNLLKFPLSPTLRFLPEIANEFVTDIALDQNEQLLTGVKAMNANILLLDIYKLAGELVTDPYTFGFSLSSEEFVANCFEPTALGCDGGITEGNVNSENPNPDNFLWNDSSHFTTIGNKIFADYIISVLNAGSELALLPSLAMDSVQAQWQAARPTMRANRWGSNLSDDDSKFSVYGTLQQSENNQDTLISSIEGENEAQSYHVGVNYHASNNAYFGVLLGRSDNELNAGASQYEMTSTDISFLGAYNNNAYFVEAIYTFSDNDYSDLDRSFSLGPLNQRTETGSTDGDTSSLAIQAGYDLFKGEENYRLGPIIGYEYIDVTVDAYQEDASLSTSLVVGEQNVSSSVLLAGLFGSIALGICDCEFYGEAVYRDEDKDGRNDVELGLVTVGNNRFTLPGQSLDDSSVTVDLGFNASLTEALSLNVSAGASDSDNSDAVWYAATLSFDL